MDWLSAVVVILIGANVAVRVFVQIVDNEYQTALAVRRAVNKSRRKLEAKMRAKVREASRHSEAA
jgi:hypothetical protein